MINVLAYIDDMVLLAPSWMALQHLLESVSLSDRPRRRFSVQLLIQSLVQEGIAESWHTP